MDDILLAGCKKLCDEFTRQVRDQYRVGTIVTGPGSMSFFGLTIIQDEAGSIQIHGGDKLSYLEPFPMSRLKRKEFEAPLNAIDLFSYGSLNDSLGFIGTAASPFCSLASSYLQQRRSAPLVKDLVCQTTLLRQLKHLVFSDAGRIKDSVNGQWEYVAGLLIGDFGQDYLFHTISWTSHKSHRPVKSIGAAATLAAGAAIDEGKHLADAFGELLGIEVDLLIAVDSKDLFDSLSTCRNATDRSIRGDVSLIRHEFEMQRVSKMIWIPVRINPADSLTKVKSPLCQMLQLLMFSGKLPTDFTAVKSMGSFPPES